VVGSTWDLEWILLTGKSLDLTFDWGIRGLVFDLVSDCVSRCRVLGASVTRESCNVSSRCIICGLSLDGTVGPWTWICTYVL